MADAAQNPATEADVLAFAKTINMGCNEGAPVTVEKIVYSFNYSYEKPTDPKHNRVYFTITCIAGAYNESSILILDDEYDGLRIIPLASPSVNSKSLVTGMTASLEVGGLTYDKQTKTLTSYHKGRGIGDMSSSGTYVFSEDEVILRKYELDNTSDEKINPKVIYESKKSLN